jgi:hypothetical protein
MTAVRPTPTRKTVIGSNDELAVGTLYLYMKIGDLYIHT